MKLDSRQGTCPRVSARLSGCCHDKLIGAHQLLRELERGERDRKRRTDLLVLAAAIAAFLPAVYGMAKPFLTAVVLSAILAVAFNPLYSRMPNAARLLLFASPLAPASPLLIEHQ